MDWASCSSWYATNVSVYVVNVLKRCTGPSTPAEWYANKFKNKQAPRTPVYNLHSPDKIEWISTNPRINNNSEYYIDQEARNRLRTLLSVDDIIDNIFQVLNNHPHVLNNTYIICTRF